MARPGLEVDLDVFGETVLRRRLLRFADRGEDMSDAWPEVALTLERAVERNFATRGVAGGHRWPDLDPAYAARTGRAPGESILRLTDRLHGSLVDRVDPEHVYEPGPDGLRWGSRVPYGRYHQSSRPRRVIPFRPPVALDERSARTVVSVLHRRLVGAMRP
jgi:phage gpG-like protein